MERKIKVGKDHNKIIVLIEKATSIQILNTAGETAESVKSEIMARQHIFYLDPGEYTLVTDGTIKDIKFEHEEIEAQIEMALLILSTDAKDFHIVDGVPEIPADGESFASIFVEKRDSSGKPLQRAKDNDELFIRTNAGALKDMQGKKEIRNINLTKGKASFRLYSEVYKRLATVQVISANPFLNDASISLEFF